MDGELESQPRREAPLPYAMWVSICKEWKDKWIVENPVIAIAQAIQVNG